VTAATWRRFAGLLALALLLGTPTGGADAAAEADTPGAPLDLQVMIDRPTSFQPVSGTVEIEAAVVGSVPVARVDFFVDGVRRGDLASPPWTLSVDVGYENEEHLFKVVAVAADGRSSAAEVRTPSYHVDEEVAVTLQQLYATVTCGGERVRGLTQDDFVLEERGRRQSIVTFGSGEVPYTAIVLLDASESMAGDKLENARRGVRAFLGGMRALDEGKLIAFSDRPRVTTPFSSLPELLTASLDELTATGGSAVHDHLYLALRQLEPRQGRRLVVLLSDGEDAHSVLDSSVLLDTVRRSQALIYWLRLTTLSDLQLEVNTFLSIWRSPEQNRTGIAHLVEAVADSGGRIEPVRTSEQIESAFRGILGELADQYAIGFYPQNRRSDDRWRKVEISVRRPGCKVRSRAGFLDL
jgi:Ca-activated chloride channel family protein